jgi:hypothetical protein
MVVPPGMATVDGADLVVVAGEDVISPGGISVVEAAGGKISAGGGGDSDLIARVKKLHASIINKVQKIKSRFIGTPLFHFIFLNLKGQIIFTLKMI